MKKLDVLEMTETEGGKCRWWQMLGGLALFAAAPVTGGVTAVPGFVAWVTSC